MAERGEWNVKNEIYEVWFLKINDLKKSNFLQKLNVILLTRSFIIYRILYLVLLTIISVKIIRFPDHDLGKEPGFVILIFGVIPIVVFIICSLFKYRYTYYIVLGYDCFLWIVLLLFLLLLPNYMGLLLFIPFGSFLLECIYFLALYFIAEKVSN